MSLSFPSFSRPFLLQGVHRLLGRNASSELAQSYLAPNQYVAHGVVVNSRGGFDVLLPGAEVKAAAEAVEDG